MMASTTFAEPVIAFVDQLLEDAIQKHISDIHLEPQENNYRIRFRCDGMLYSANSVSIEIGVRIATRLKVMAQLDIAEKRLPQDGRISVTKPHKMDLRVNTCPTINGEKIVLRILNVKQCQLDIRTLGLSESQLQLVLNKLQQPQGLILVTGPTGSGKTMTLYAMLQYLNHIEKNIVTIEDPVEIELPGINQIAVNSRIGLDFATILRTLLRQDPNIIMIGEIRDKETAQIAMQAAQTGHLVLATLHTNSALDTLTRLQTLGIHVEYLVHAISLVMAQRLLRKLCDHCKSFQQLTCDQCHQGYLGRIGIFECLPITQTVANLLLQHATHDALLAHIQSQAWPLLKDSGNALVNAQITHHNELLRVMGHEFI